MHLLFSQMNDQMTIMNEMTGTLRSHGTSLYSKSNFEIAVKDVETSCM